MTHFARWRLDADEVWYWNMWMDQLPVDFTSWVVPAVPASIKQSAAAEPEQPDVEFASIDVTGEATLPPPVAFDALVQSWLAGAGAESSLGVERVLGSSLPWFERPARPCPAGVVERLLASLDGLGTTAQQRWLRVQLLCAAAFEITGTRAVDGYESAMAMTMATEDGDGIDEADWQALRLRVHQVWLQRQGAAARMLGLARMHEALPLLSRARSVQVQRVWLDVLLEWASQLRGSSALHRFGEAEAVCAVIGAEPGRAADAQRLLAETLMQRAPLEHGGVRNATLLRARSVAEDAFRVSQAADAALTLARANLSLGLELSGTEAAALLEQALMHAVTATSDPQLAPAALQCRLAVQMAYEAQAGMPPEQSVAAELGERLHRQPQLALDTWGRIVDLYLQRGQFQRACEAAAEAASRNCVDLRLISLWERASAGWRTQLVEPAARLAWQHNIRARQSASLHVTI